MFLYLLRFYSYNFIVKIHFCLVKLSRSISLLEVVLHVTLKVEVGKLVILLELEKLGKLAIGVDDTSIALVLKLMCLDVSIDLLAYLSTCHLGSYILTKKVSELITDTGRLNKTRRLTVSSVSALLG